MFEGLFSPRHLPVLGMFEGLFSPSHLLILALILFIVIGPRRVANRMNRTRDRVRQFTDDEPPNAPESPAQAPGTPETPTASRSLAYRVGRLLRGRRSG